MENGRNWQSLSSGEIYGSLKIVCERNKVHFTSTGTRSDVFNKDSVSDDGVDDNDANESLTDDEVERNVWKSAEKKFHFLFLIFYEGTAEHCVETIFLRRPKFFLNPFACFHDLPQISRKYSCVIRR